MASSKGQARGRAGKKRVAKQTLRPGVRARAKPTRREHANAPRRGRKPYDSVSIPQLVYQLLTIDKYNQDARRSSPEGFKTPPRRMQRYRKGLPYEAAVDRRESSGSVQTTGYATESRPTSTESLMEMMDAANTSPPTSSANSSVSNVSTGPTALANSLNSARTLFKKRSLVQLINNYIKAGIEEGKRQARKYVRKALSFGVRSGYLIPADPCGNVLRVCPSLTGARRADAESRRKRRVARRGGETTRLTTIDDRRAMRRGIPRGDPRHDAHAETTMSRRRRGRQPAVSPADSVSTEGSSLRGSPDAPTSLREKNKPKNGTRRRSRIDDRVNNKRGQQRKRGDSADVRKPVKRRRTASSPKRVVNNQEPAEKSYKDANGRDRDHYVGDEDNYRAEGRKSTSRREDGARMEKRKIGVSIDYVDVDDRDAERRNDNDKSEETSVEQNANGATREMNI